MARRSTVVQSDRNRPEPAEVIASIRCRALGLDGFSKGWVAVLLDGDLSRDQVLPQRCRSAFHRLRPCCHRHPHRHDRRRRAGLRLARPVNGCVRMRHACSTGARRWLWEEFTDPDAANRDALRRGQKRVSRQLWHLGPKISEVDAFVRANGAHDIREAHPELVFLRLNAGRPSGFEKVGGWNRTETQVAPAGRDSRSRQVADPRPYR